MHRWALVTLCALMLCACGTGGFGGSGRAGGLQIATTSLPQAVVGVPYSVALQAQSGESPYVWMLGSGTLPAGLTLDSMGAISGTPTAPISAPLGIVVRDRLMNTAIATLTLDVVPPATLTLAGSAPPAFINTPYSFNPVAAGGIAPYAFSLQSGALPAGLSLDASTGAISGTPLATGASSAVLQVADSLSAIATLALDIPVFEPVSITTFATMPNGFVGAAYYARFDAKGGLPPYIWTLNSAPAWLSAATLGDGFLELTGTPGAASAPGTPLLADISVTDSAGSTASVLGSFAVDPAPVSPAAGIVTTQLRRAKVGVYYEHEMEALGGTTWFEWSTAATTELPEGLYLDSWPASRNILRGTPRRAGVYDVDFIADDRTNPPATRRLTMIVECDISMPAATAGTQYDAAVVVRDGGTGYSAAAASAETFNGLTIAAQSITGVPRASGRAAFCAAMSGAAGTFNQLVGFDVAAAPAALTISTTQLPAGIAGSGYSYQAQLKAEGGTGIGFQWTLVSGSNLPPGLSGLPASGPAFPVISGSPSTAGVYSFDVSVTDSGANVATATISLTIRKPLQGDFDGDGYADLVIGTPYNIGIVSPGGVIAAPTGIYVFYGDPAKPRFGAIGHDAADLCIYCSTDCLSLCDVNGDGISDIVLSTPLGGGLGGSPYVDHKVRIYFGSANRRTGTLTANQADGAITGPAGVDFGRVAACGDLDGDGCGEIMVSAPAQSTAAGGLAGKTYIFYGGPSAFVGGRTHASADAVLEGDAAGSGDLAMPGFMGDSIFARDLNGDGRAEMLLGARANVHLVYGSAARLAGVQSITAARGAYFSGCFGSKITTRLAVGDVNGDGNYDVFVGGRTTFGFYGASGAMPFSGQRAASAADVTINHNLPQVTNYVCVTVAEINNDSFADVVIGNPDSGGAYIFHGGASFGGPALSWTQAGAVIGFGTGVGGAWSVTACDHDSDGKTDLLVGCPNIQNLRPNTRFGAGFMYYNASIPTSGTAYSSAANVRYMVNDGVGGYSAVACGG